MTELEESLDRVFGKYIKLRDTDSNYRGHCITCSRSINITEGDPGHCLSRNINLLAGLMAMYFYNAFV